jgi:hypothetical protein
MTNLARSNTGLCHSAWSAGIQVDTDVSGGILRVSMRHPCRHDEIFIFYLL